MNRIFGAHMLVADKPNTNTGTNRYKLVPRPVVSVAAPAAAGEPSSDSAGAATTPDGAGGGETTGGAHEPPAHPTPEQPQT